MYSIMLKRTSQVNNQSLWTFYEKVSGITFETDDLTTLQGEMKYLLTLNPIPVLKVVTVVPFDVAVDITTAI